MDEIEPIDESLLDVSAIETVTTDIEPMASSTPYKSKRSSKTKKCDDCAYVTTTTTSLLNRHRRKHTVPQFNCKDYNRSFHAMFHEMYTLNNHGCTTKTKNCMCSECGNTFFFTKEGLKNHMFRIHTPNKCKHKFKLCNERFMNKKHLNIDAHGPTFGCKKVHNLCQCGSKFTNKCNLARHEKSCNGTCHSGAQMITNALSVKCHSHEQTNYQIM